MLSFTLNAGFATAFFIFGVKDLATNGSCYVSYPTETPVDIATFDPLANPGNDPTPTNVKKLFSIVCLSAFIGYAFATLGSFGYCFKAGQKLQALEKYARYLIYAIFVACHVIRFSFAGKVCSGDYLTGDLLPDGSSPDPNQYLFATGDWLMTYIIAGWIIMPIMLFIMVVTRGDTVAAFVLQAPK